jgi:hypothetical protein
MPFKYGKASLVAAPVLHVRAQAADDSGNRVEGYSADVLPPKWFDKDPEKDFRQNVEDLLTAARCGAEAYLELGNTPAGFFDIWKPAYARTLQQTGVRRLNELTGSFGSTLMERALLDAIAKLSGSNLLTCLRENRIGLDPGAVHKELKGRSIAQAIPETPSPHVAVRHTVGLADPIWENEIPENEKLNDGLPQSLETWIRDFGIRYFKIKVTNNLEFDLPRLESIGRLLESSAPSDWAITLDGNETFRSMAELEAWLGKAKSVDSLVKLFERVIYIEQPLERSVAFQPGVETHLRNMEETAPVIIDESDDAIGTFKRAAEIGYRGVSVKNCKGVIKGLLNKMLIDLYNDREGGGYILAGEDLMNLPVVPVQQDLTTANILGLSHVERNGHNYCRGLDHLSEKERKDCLSLRGDLYEPFESSARLRIRDGLIDVRSLHEDCFGACMRPDFESMTPLADWSFDSLDEGT